MSSIYDVVELSVSLFDCVIFREATPVPLGRGWMDPRAGVGAVKKRKLLGLPGIELDSQVVQSVVELLYCSTRVFVGNVKCTFQNPLLSSEVCSVTMLII